jgi:hypothetical protein
MRVITLRSKIRQDSLANVEGALEKMLSAIEQARPTGVRFTSCRLTDGNTFVNVLELDEGADNPLPLLPAAEEFRQNLRNWVVEAPVREEFEVVGAYRSDA